MITNLLASLTVALSTNVSTNVTAWARWEPTACPENRPGCLVAHFKGVDPVEQTITTAAVRTHRLSFPWMGATQTVQHAETLWTTNQVMRLEWRPATPAAVKP